VIDMSASQVKPPPAPPAAPSRGGDWGRTALASYGVVGILGLLVVAWSLAMPDKFATSGNFQSIVNSQATVLILAMAVVLTLRVGDFDLSVAANMGFTASIVATLTATHHVAVAPAIAITIAAGAFVGLVNGLVIVVGGIDAFIVTLGSMTLLGGLAYAITDSTVVSSLPAGLTDVSRTQLAGLPLATWLGWLLVLVLWYVYEHTGLGRYLLFVGGNRDAARLSGLPVRRIRLLSFVGSGTIAAIAGVLLAGNLGAVDPSIGPEFLLQPFAAAFLSTTVIHPGRFNAVGAVVGLYLLAVMVTGLQLLGVESWVANVFNGAALIIAVLVAHILRTRSARDA
jgi:ribose transport system permease protein